MVRTLAEAVLSADARFQHIAICQSCADGFQISRCPEWNRLNRIAMAAEKAAMEAIAPHSELMALRPKASQ